MDSVLFLGKPPASRHGLGFRVDPFLVQALREEVEVEMKNLQKARENIKRHLCCRLELGKARPVQSWHQELPVPAPAEAEQLPRVHLGGGRGPGAGRGLFSRTKLPVSLAAGW